MKRDPMPAESAPDAPKRVVLDVQGLHTGYGRVPVVHGISLRLHEGEALGVVGHNGMGKTTLLKAIMGQLPATAGRIEIAGVDMTHQPAYTRSRHGVGYVAQGRGILPGLTTHENLRLAWNGDTDETEQEAVERVVGMFPLLQPLLDRRGGTLSGGEQQVLALSRALIPNPWIVLLDEPAEGIQPSIVHQLGQMLSRLRTEHGLAVLIVEQNLDLVLDVATRFAVIEKGRVVQEFGAGESGSREALAAALGLGTVRGVAPPSRPAASLSVPANSFSASPKPAPTPWAASAAHLPSSPPAATHPAPGAIQPTRPAPNPSHEVTMATVKRPTLDQMRHIVGKLHMSMSDAEIAEYLQVMDGTLQAYDRLTQIPDYLPPVRYARTPGYRPGATENPLGAWAVKTEIRGAAYGPLAGKRIVMKDNVCVAGVPMMNGASTLEGYVPDVDATVVTRVLDAGGTIVGKAVCESFCLSGGSHTSQSGPVHNPYRHGYSSGGSSSGCGALVGAGEVEMAIGGDQGGSIRMPGAWCGIYGMKATHGLVPYTGVMPIEATIDHTGPMTATVADNALLLEVIAGADGMDPRQYDVRVDKYTSALARGVAGMRIGVVTEGFGHPASEADVDQKVREAAQRFAALGASVSEISVPMHLDGPASWPPSAVEGRHARATQGSRIGCN